MKTKSTLNTNSAVKAPDTLSVLRGHYLQVTPARPQMIWYSEIHIWMQNPNKIA